MDAQGLDVQVFEAQLFEAQVFEAQVLEIELVEVPLAVSSSNCQRHLIRPQATVDFDRDGTQALLVATE